MGQKLLVIDSGFLVVRFLILLLFSASLFAAEWQELIRRDHPRLFLNRETLPLVKARALGEEREAFEAMRSRVDALLSDGFPTKDYGVAAAESAFVFLVTDDPQYRELAARLLETSLKYYDERFAAQREVNWYSDSRINAWTAYDWLFHSLDPERRQRIGAALLRATENEQPTKARKPFERENWLGPISGFYSTPSLLWYAGLATYQEGIDDECAARFLTEGRKLYLELLSYRSRMAGDDGGSASGALNYSLAAYPWAEFNFFRTYLSATGQDIAREWPYVAWLSNYIFWNWLPGAHEFGFGDAYHTVNRMPLGELDLHLTQLIDLYAHSRPEAAELAKWLSEKTPREKRASFPFTRFLLTSVPDVKPAQDPGRRMPLARHFENMGQTFLRSGSGPEDTYALFTAGGNLEMHKHFDHNNFVIYKKGFLALDTGTRPEPGQHLMNYYSRTVAHNSILIHMPGEVMPRYWGHAAPSEEPLPPPNDGGQHKGTGSRVVAFESRPEYAYVAGDATPVYDARKCELALRQFVFLPPDYFVVFDRVISKDPSYQKTWLLHTAAEPRFEGSEFSAVQDEGKLFCRTLLPEKAERVKIGGPEKQFWSGGRNWPLPKGYRTDPNNPLLGQWRVEVSPSKPSTSDVFLHLLQAGDRNVTHMVQSKLIRKGKQVGVRFTAGADTWEVLFATEAGPAGHIRLHREGRLLVDRDLTTTVMPQQGLAYEW